MSGGFSSLQPRLRAFLLAFLCTIVLVQSVSAVTMATSQLDALLDVADQVPALKTLSSGAWTSSNIAASCDTPNTALGISSCNSTGYVTSLTISSGTGPAPESIANLSALTALSTSYTMTGSLPASWAALTNLATLDITNTQLVGGLPDVWTAMPLSVANVVFNATNSVLSVPPTWLSKLASYSITNANWSETSFPAWIVNSTVTTSISLVNCPMAGSFPSALSTNVVLDSFTYTTASEGSSTSFGSGTALPNFSAMTLTTTFALGGLGYSGGFASVAIPVNAQTVSLSDLPNLSGSIPQSLLDTTSLTSLTLAGMPLVTGNVVVPSDASESVLETLVFDNLGLDGTIPQQALASSTASLTITNMAKLRGPFPEPFTAAQVTSDASLACDITTIVLSGNPSFGGSIPTTLMERCSNIESLVLDSSALVGSIPSSFSSIASTVFSSLSISGNPTNGTIPNIGPWHSSSTLSLILSNASLTGSIPAALVTRHFSTFDLSQNELDLCSTTAAATQSYSTYFSAASGATCDLSFQAPQECGCTGTWPSACFTRREMLATCASGTTPSSNPPTSSSSGPSSEPASTTVVSPTGVPFSSAPTSTNAPTSGRIRVEPFGICYSGQDSHGYHFFGYRNNNTFSVSASEVSESVLYPDMGTVPSVFTPGIHYYAAAIDNRVAYAATWSLDGYTATVLYECIDYLDVNLTLSFSSVVADLDAIVLSVANLTGATTDAVTAYSSAKRANDVTITILPNSGITTAIASARILNNYGSITDGTATATSATLDSLPTISEAIVNTPVYNGPVAAAPIDPPITEISWPELHAPHGINHGQTAGIVIGAILAVITLTVVLIVVLTKTPHNPRINSKNPSTTRGRARYANHASVATEPAYEAPSTKTAGDDAESEDAPFAEKKSESSSDTSSTDDSEEMAEEDDE